MNKEEYYNKILDKICMDIELLYPGCICHGIIQFHSGAVEEIKVEIFNLTDSQLLSLSYRKLELAKKYYNQLGEILILRLWNIKQTQEYFQDTIEMIFHKRLYREYKKSLNILSLTAQALVNNITQLSMHISDVISHFPDMTQKDQTAIRNCNEKMKFNLTHTPVNRTNLINSNIVRSENSALEDVA